MDAKIIEHNLMRYKIHNFRVSLHVLFDTCQRHFLDKTLTTELKVTPPVMG